MGAVKLGVVGDIEQLNDQVAGEQLCHKSVLKEEVTICDSMQDSDSLTLRIKDEKNPLFLKKLFFFSEVFLDSVSILTQI